MNIFFNAIAGFIFYSVIIDNSLFFFRSYTEEEFAAGIPVKDILYYFNRIHNFVSGNSMGLESLIYLFEGRQIRSTEFQLSLTPHKHLKTNPEFIKEFYNRYYHSIISFRNGSGPYQAIDFDKSESLTKTSVEYSTQKKVFGYIENILIKRAAPPTVASSLFNDGNLGYFNLNIPVLGTKFQMRVLKETARINFGSLLTYKKIAERIKNPKSFRAVGNALNKNPVMIFIPCHRIIKSDLSIGGFRSGTSLKEKLINRESLLKNSNNEINAVIL